MGSSLGRTAKLIRQSSHWWFLFVFFAGSLLKVWCASAVSRLGLQPCNRHFHWLATGWNHLGRLASRSCSWPVQPVAFWKGAQVLNKNPEKLFWKMNFWLEFSSVGGYSSSMLFAYGRAWTCISQGLRLQRSNWQTIIRNLVFFGQNLCAVVGASSVPRPRHTCPASATISS
jgi:hypothetical protein